MAQIDDFLREAASGRPVHFSLFGAQGDGKSSLLNVVVEMARARGLLSVKLALSEALVQTGLDFYKAVYDAALQALIDMGHLVADGELMRAWTLQTCLGEPPSKPDVQPLELGMLAAAGLHGRMVGEVPTQLIQRDLKRFLSLGPVPLQGLVLCLDSAHWLGDNRDLAPSLLQLADATPLLTIVTAAEASGDLQEAAPRAWAQIEVKPFTQPVQVLDAVAKPLESADETLVVEPPTPLTAADILQLTGGGPYEVNLVCHFIWEAIRHGEQDSFELSPAVIERVAAELEEKGRHQASPEIATLSGLPATELRTLVLLAPFEELTTHQIALVRLLLRDFGDSDLTDAEDAIGQELSALQERGLVQIEQDRFKLTGGRDARVYLRYAAKRVSPSSELRFGRDYPRTVASRCATALAGAVLGESYEGARLFRRGRPREIGQSAAGRLLESLGRAADEGDLVGLGTVLGGWVGPAEMQKHSGCGFWLMGLTMQVGVHEVEHVELVAGPDGGDPSELQAAGQNWLEENRELLAKYGAQDAELRCHQISWELLASALSYWLLAAMSQVAFFLYRAGSNELAEDVLTAVLHQCEPLIGAEPLDPLLRTQVANVLSRRGFMAATRGDWQAASELLEQSATMALTEGWLLDYNRAYVCAMRGQIADAIRLIESAVERLEPDSGLVVLHAFMPTPDEWIPPDPLWNVVEVQGAWVGRFLELQRCVIRARSSEDSRAALESAVRTLSPSAPMALIRLAGWATLTSRAAQRGERPVRARSPGGSLRRSRGPPVGG
ncbi:ATP-binding protein [Baekduia soli]|uniref:ATP-binding protein n=1 Tax=Baekduia soli TaxID=496014 RepID=UPI0016529CB3|nr:ATP-binding protein [Baekduia soli]